MSQDLLSAFGEAPGEPSINKNTPTVEDEDDFGDFEDASASIQAIDRPQIGPSHKKVISDFTKPPPSKPQEAKSFPPKAARKPEPPRQKEAHEDTGSHPFAGRWDLLFEEGDDEYDAGTDELADLATNPEAAMAYSKRIIAEQEAAQAKKGSVKQVPPKPDPPKTVSAKSLGKQTASSHSQNASNSDSGPKKLRKKSGYVPAYEPEVLFDAENVSDHESGFDDFGDFEAESQAPTSTVTPIARVERAQTTQAILEIDLLGLDEPSAVPEVRNGHINSTWKSSAIPAKPIATSQADDVDDDAWDDFETAAPASPPFMPETTNHARSSSNAHSPITSTSNLAPTNIPPPSVLLSLFPPLFRSADEALFNMMTKLDLKQRQVLLCHPASHQFLKSYLMHAVVLARIVAGRKLRWKRDQHLTQSMRIGPSAAGGKSGMKLAGVDKAEVAKEDREVLDTLDQWKAQVGKLRTAVTAASSAPGLPKLPAVPEIVENTPVRTLKAGEGGISASHACALCGLRREERVVKVDLEVEDSFGEWWVEGMNMHVACKNFWHEFEKKLKSR